MKSGLLAAEAIHRALQDSRREPDYQTRFEASWLYDELAETRNFGANLHKFGSLFGGALSTFEHNLWLPLIKKPIPWTVKDHSHDHEQLKPKNECPPIEYPNRMEKSALINHLRCFYPAHNMKKTNRAILF